MNRVNPLHIGILLVVLLSFVILELNGIKDELIEVKESYKETLVMARELNALDGVYSDKQRIKKSLSRILKQSSLKSANIKQNIGKSSVVLSSASMSKVAINSLMAKILNGSYDLTSLKIKRLSAKTVSLKMEIKW